MKINFKIILVGLVPLLLYIYFAYVYIEKNEDIKKNQIYMEEASLIHNKLETLIKEKKEAVLLISTSLSANENIKDILLLKHKNNFNLKEFSLRLRENSSLRNVWFQIISSDGVSLYRSWTNKYGDSIVDARVDVAKIIDLPRIMSSISTGKYDMTFKSMVPIFDNNKFIGVIETIAKFNSISKKMQKIGYNNVILVDKSYKKQLTKAFTQMFVDDYYVANLNADKTIMNLLHKNSVEEYIGINKYKIDEKNNLFLTTYKLADMNGKNMGYFIFSEKLKNIDISDIEKEKQTILFVFILIFLSISGMLYYFYIINYKNFVEIQNKILEDSVEDKTKELKDKSKILKYQAEHDPLTKLPNRLLFLDRLKQAIKHAKRREQKVSVLFLDLDRFKEINDSYGHEAGDKLLKRVTTRLQQSVRDEDTVARLGGDEFTIILQNLEQKDIIKIIDKIMNHMQEAFFINDVELFTTFSIGISNYPDDGETPEILLRNADTAMYKAKDSGKNNYQFYDEEMTKIAFERVQLEQDIRNALANNEFEPYFQPKIDAKNSKIIGVEALIRWIHPEKGIIFPDKFIPFAEEIGLINEIDDYMMLSSMKQVLKWQEEGIECGKLSLNLSVKQLSSKNYVTELKENIYNIGFDTKYLELEITESYIMDDPDRAISILNEIRSLGISISIDDFGTGYSSLSYLKKLPITKLKIDRSFIMDIPKDKDDVAIVKTIISLAENLGLGVIAEGVETKEQVDFLVKEGCKNIQGYYFSKPLSSNDLERFIIQKLYL